MSVPIEHFRFSVEDYHKLAEVGVLREDARVELLGGEIVMMTPIGPRHAACVDRLNRLLSRAAGDAAIVRIQNPVRLSGDTEPEPDVSLLRPRDDFYVRSAPTADDLLLVIEVAGSSLAFDREVKLPQYARAGVAELWIVDLDGRRILTFRAPAGRAYAQSCTFAPGTTVRPVQLDVELAVDDILP